MMGITTSEHKIMAAIPFLFLLILFHKLTLLHNMKKLLQKNSLWLKQLTLFDHPGCINRTIIPYIDTVFGWLEEHAVCLGA
jgi:hypothetical protein